MFQDLHKGTLAGQIQGANFGDFNATSPPATTRGNGERGKKIVQFMTCALPVPDRFHEAPCTAVRVQSFQWFVPRSGMVHAYVTPLQFVSQDTSRK